jgi:thiol-disulfide isomerase/thioredoxin
MLDYMKEMAMPWPAVRYGDLRHDGNGTFKSTGIEQFAGTGIPDLVLVDADGKVLSDSFTWTGSYLGPRHVLDDIDKLVSPGAPAPVPASASAAPNPPPPPSKPLAAPDVNGQTASAPTAPSSSPTTLPVPAASPEAPATAATPPTSAPAANPLPDAVKLWAPPDVMPAQPNWTWTTSDGKTYQNVVVTKIEAETVSVTHSMGVAHIPINLLPPDIQKQLNYDPHAAAQIPSLIADKLVSADGTAANAPGKSVQYYAIYYSAQWCPPCHAFTPRLVSWYNKFKPAHPNFELIFVSEDRDEAAMLSYMKEMTMPWPAVRFSDLKHDGGFKGSGIEKFAGDGIPDLVLLDAGGKVLSDSYQNGTYVGPEAVVEDINKLIGGEAPVPLVHQTPSAPAARPALISAQDSFAARASSENSPVY